MIRLTSPAFNPGGLIPTQYTCDGDNISPPLIIANVPDGTESLVLTVNDPDAPLGDWIHWIMWNIDPQTETIPSGKTPARSVVGVNSFGANDYGGPCPPDGTHRYYFRVYALDTVLTLGPDTQISKLQSAMIGHILSQGELLGHYTSTRSDSPQP